MSKMMRGGNEEEKMNSQHLYMEAGDLIISSHLDNNSINGKSISLLSAIPL
jgi:hypothetical protein